MTITIHSSEGGYNDACLSLYTVRRQRLENHLSLGFETSLDSIAKERAISKKEDNT